MVRHKSFSQEQVPTNDGSCSRPYTERIARAFALPRIVPYLIDLVCRVFLADVLLAEGPSFDDVALIPKLVIPASPPPLVDRRTKLEKRVWIVLE